jgi:hypothetical protein
MVQLSGGEPLSLEIMAWSVSMVFPFGLRNTAEDVHHLIALCFGSPPVDHEYVRMADYVSESFHDLLAGESETISDSNSSMGSHHPSLECFMADHSKGHAESTRDGNTPSNGPDAGARVRNQAPPHVQLEQLWEWQKSIEEARLQLSRSILNSSEISNAARDVNRRILEDD